MKIGCRTSTGAQSLKRISIASKRPSKTISKWEPPASGRDPFGFQRAETFWNSRGHGLRPWCRGQFQLSFSLKPQRVSAPPVKSTGDSHLLTSAL
jgi:hypothetical protein